MKVTLRSRLNHIGFLSDSLIIYIFVYLFVSLLVYFIPALS